MQVMISSIKVPDRIRKDLGNLEPLMQSLSRCGQLNPITVTRDLELVAGHRRLTAAQRLGWKMIDATIVDGLTDERRLEMEIEENIYRMDFTPDELLEGIKRLEAVRNPRLGARISRAVKGFFGKLAFWKRKRPARASHAGQSTRHPLPTPVADDEHDTFGV
ncbi:MAG: ParB N-terminal domain-containing protein [Kiritimatiellia bacterium]|jgi:ParB family chromosome partitioning protein